MSIHMVSGTAKREKGILTFRPYNDLLAGQDEAQEQQYLFGWIFTQELKDESMSRIYHIPNEGKRSKAAAGKLKAQGLRKGALDICYPSARGGYNNLYIELKVGKNKPTPEQHDWLIGLEKGGCLACVCYGWQIAADVIEAYASGQLKK